MERWPGWVDLSDWLLTRWFIRSPIQVLAQQHAAWSRTRSLFIFKSDALTPTLPGRLDNKLMIFDISCSTLYIAVHTMCRLCVDWRGPIQLCICDADNEHSGPRHWSPTAVSRQHVWILTHFRLWLLGRAHCRQVRYCCSSFTDFQLSAIYSAF